MSTATLLEPAHTGKDPCPACGGGECGLHPMGCIYGGFSALTAYWLVVEDCPLDHGEER